MAHPARDDTNQAAPAGVRRPLGDVLETLAAELEQLRCLGLRVESAMCQIVVRAAIDPAVVGELQQLDMVLQQLGALRAYTAQIAQECAAKGEVSIGRALDSVTLAELRARLAGHEEEDVSDLEGWEIL